MSCNNFVLLVLCCSWIGFGEGDVIGGIKTVPTLLDVIPSNHIIADSREYVTVSLNVEYRNDTKCNIGGKKGTSDLFQRVGACGFRGLADKIKGSSWTIIEETKSSHQYKGTVTIKTGYSLPTKIHFYKSDPRPVIPLNAFDKDYCRIINPTEKNIKKMTGSEYVIDVEEKHSGKWIVQYFYKTNTPINKTYDVTFEEKIEPVMEFFVSEKSVNGSSIKFRCSVDFESISQCSFHGPSGIIVNEEIAVNSKKFNYEVSSKEGSDNDRSFCELTIHNLTSGERGEWLCSLRDEIQIANGTEFLSDVKEELTVDVFQKIGSGFDLNCTQNYDWKNCRFQRSSDLILSDSFNHVPTPNVDDKDRTCSKKIESANKTLDGNWTCSVSRGDGRFKDKRILIVRVTEDFALGDLRYEDVTGINQTILEASPFPTEENKMKNIINCVWTHPVDEIYLSNDLYYNMTNDNNVCQLIMNYPQEYDQGNWTCTIILKSSNGAWDSFVALFNVKEVEIYSMFWWYILYGFIVVLIIIAVILFVRWDLTFKNETKHFNAENEQKARRFKEYFQGDLNKTTKPSSDRNQLRSSI